MLSIEQPLEVRKLTVDAGHHQLRIATTCNQNKASSSVYLNDTATTRLIDVLSEIISYSENELQPQSK
ncbi:hypothetical protein C6H64_03845 [Photorhabdus luminescens]|nr:hypothetical protein C6H64_03845 [Photorhabdus luminescens]